MKKSCMVLAVLLGISFVNASAEDGAALYKKCGACHGMNGEKAALGKSKVLKEMSKDAIVAALKGYQDGSYGGATKGMMKGQVTSLNDAQIKAIASHIGK
ncbi:MAG: c-type cytochrome [Sulfuricurvum sp.]|nr:c-type cytochrome [Sulfuricurvum sp.]